MEALRVLQEICELAPDVRLGQLFSHLGFLGETHLGPSLAVLEDDELLSILYRHREELSNRLPKPAIPLAETNLLASGGVASRPTP